MWTSKSRQESRRSPDGLLDRGLHRPGRRVGRHGEREVATDRRVAGRLAHLEHAGRQPHERLDVELAHRDPAREVEGGRDRRVELAEHPDDLAATPRTVAEPARVHRLAVRRLPPSTRRRARTAAPRRRPSRRTRRTRAALPAHPTSAAPASDERPPPALARLAVTEPEDVARLEDRHAPHVPGRVAADRAAGARGGGAYAATPRPPAGGSARGRRRGPHTISRSPVGREREQPRPRAAPRRPWRGGPGRRTLALAAGRRPAGPAGASSRRARSPATRTTSSIRSTSRSRSTR